MTEEGHCQLIDLGGVGDAYGNTLQPSFETAKIPLILNDHKKKHRTGSNHTQKQKERMSKSAFNIVSMSASGVSRNYDRTQDNNTRDDNIKNDIDNNTDISSLGSGDHAVAITGSTRPCHFPKQQENPVDVMDIPQRTIQRKLSIMGTFG